MTTQYDLILDDFDIGARVETHPATDAWMSGDRFGTVVKVGNKYVQVEMDRSGKVRRFEPKNLGLVLAPNTMTVEVKPAQVFKNYDGRTVSTRSSNPRKRKLAKRLARQETKQSEGESK